MPYPYDLEPLYSLIQEYFPDNATGQILPADARGVLAALAQATAKAPNVTVGAAKRVRFLTQAQLAIAPDGGDSLEGILNEHLTLGNEAWVEFHPTRGAGVLMRLVYDGEPRPAAAAGVRAFRTGHAVAGDTVPAVWVPADSPEAVRVNVPTYDPAFNASGTPPGYPLGYLVFHTLGGVEGQYVAQQPGQLPAPTNPVADGNWRRVAAPVPAAALYQVMPWSAAVNYDSDDALSRGREYLITERPGGGPDVRGTFSRFAPAVMAYAVVEGQPGSFVYDLLADTATSALAELYTPVLPFVVARADGTEDLGQTTLLGAVKAAGIAGAGSIVYVNRPCKLGHGEVPVLKKGVILDLQNNPIDLSGIVIRMGRDSVIRNNRLLYSGRLAPDYPDGLPDFKFTVQGGALAGRINYLINNDCTAILDDVAVVGFGQAALGGLNIGKATSAEVGPKVVLRNGAYFAPNHRAHSNTVITVEAPTVGDAAGERYDLATFSGSRTNTLVFELPVVLSSPIVGPAIASFSAQVIIGSYPLAAAAPVRTGTAAQIVAAINADIAALTPAQSTLYYVRTITVPVATTDETHLLLSL